jgi:hypothetical protein
VRAAKTVSKHGKIIFFLLFLLLLLTAYGPPKASYMSGYPDIRQDFAEKGASASAGGYPPADSKYPDTRQGVWIWLRMAVPPPPNPAVGELFLCFYTKI